MKSYGGPVTRLGLADVACKPKSWCCAKLQRGLLGLFGSLDEESNLARLYSRSARRLIGAYLYSLKIEVNNICSHRCKMCYVPKGDLELDRAAIDRVLEAIAGYGVRIEILGGEPLLRRDLADIVRAAKERARSPMVSVYTNAVHATEPLALALRQAGLDAAIVTLVSHRADIHDQFTGVEGSWQRTVDGIRRLRAAGLEVYTFTSVHAVNAGDVRDVYGFARDELSVHALFFQYVPQRRADPLVIDPQRWHEIKHWVLVEKNPQQAAFVRDFYMLTGSACSGGNFVLTIRADGTVQPCPFIFDLPLGNIHDTDIWAIYKRRFSQPGLVEFKQVPPDCVDCSYASVCAGGCRAGNRALFGSYGHRDHRCLGPHREPVRKAEVIDHVPAFF